MSSVWVTGAKGFIGRHVSLRARNAGFDVAGIGLGDWGDLPRSSWGVSNWVAGGISFDVLNRLAERVGEPKAIIHLAGGSSVGASFVDPHTDFQRTVGSLSTLMEWIRLYSPSSHVVLASSAAVYGAEHSAPIPEDVLLRPYSPYGFHKRMAELLLCSYASNFGINSAIVRLFSVYGPEIRKQLLWDLCGKLRMRPSSLIIDGTGQEQRDWLYVTDAADFLIHAVQIANLTCPIINGGTGLGISVEQIAYGVVNAWGIDCDVAFTGLTRQGDPRYLVADVTTANSFGLMTSVGWDEGVRAYVAWAKSVLGVEACG